MDARPLRRLPGLAITCALLLTACGPAASPRSSGSAVVPCTSAATGLGCPPGASLELQPDVVVVQGGASALVAPSTDGLSWRIRAAAPGADRVAVGRVVLLTDVIVGRVLRVADAEGERVVTLGPAALTDVIRNGELGTREPVAIGDPTVLLAPDLPGTIVEGSDVEAQSSPSAVRGNGPVVTLADARVAAASPRPPSRQPKVPGVHLGPGRDFDVLCCDVLGAVLHYDRNGLRIDGVLWYWLAQPVRVGYHLIIQNGRIVTGDLTILGIKGVHVEVEAASDNLAGNINETYLLPVEFRFPSVGAVAAIDPHEPVFAAPAVMQFFDVGTSFSARTGSLKGRADYDFDSDELKIEVKDGKLDQAGRTGPTGFTVRQPLLDTITGLSVGVEGLFLGLSTRFCICLGSLVASDGLFYQLTTVVALSNDSNAVAVLGGRCRGATFETLARVGDGHRLYDGFVKAINKTLNEPGDQPLTGSGGQVSGAIRLWSESATDPVGLKRCT